MAATYWPTASRVADSKARPRKFDLASLWRRVESQPHEFDLFYLLRVLDARSGHGPRLGYATRPQDEPLRIGQEPSLAFAPTTLASASPREGGGTPKLSIFSLGLFGANGPLPLHLTEYARERLRNHGDATLSAFADVFHHRMILLFYRAWSDAQASTSLDRGGDSREPFSDYVASLVHLGQPSLRRRDSLPDHAKYHMAGHLVRQTRNPEGLRQILQSYLKIPVAINEYQQNWISIEPHQRMCLRRHAATHRLAHSAILGIAVRDVQSSFEIVLGPLNLEQYTRFLPDGSATPTVLHWVRNYIGIELAWSMRVVLMRDQVRGGVLGTNSQRLGWGSWLGARTSGTDADDLCFEPEPFLGASGTADMSRYQAERACSP